MTACMNCIVMQMLDTELSALDSLHNVCELCEYINKKLF